MSEIKGQLLGIILVIMIFGIVAAGLTAVFRSLSTTVTNEVSEVLTSYAMMKL